MDYLRKGLVPVLVCATLLMLPGCYPTLKKEARRPQESLVPVHFFVPHFHDDLGKESLILALERNLIYLNRVDPEAKFQYGPDQFTCREVRESQEAFLRLLKEVPDPDNLDRRIRKEFKIYRAAGRVGDNHTLFTGYFVPTYEASLVPTEEFRYPLYRRPDDLLKIDLSAFDERFRGQSLVARIQGKKVVPYYSRYEIEVEKVLSGKNLEIAWLKDPLDVCFLHIQGSGRLLLPDGRWLWVGYQASNGRPYRSIGRFMVDKGLLKREEVSMQRIRSYLSAHPDQTAEILNHNSSYVFFRVLEEGPMGSLNIPLTPGRSLALDRRLFPKGALAFMVSEKPVLDQEGKIRRWTKFARFVLVQDTGGAIKGAGRADLFWGSGLYSEIAAGHMKQEGELYVLIRSPH